MLTWTEVSAWEPLRHESVCFWRLTSLLSHEERGGSAGAQ